MTEKKSLILFFILLIVSFSYLALTERKQMDPEYQKNWWSIAFKNPSDSELEFFIENHSEQDRFSWKIKNEKGDDIQSGSVKINRGEIKTVAINKDLKISGKITIQVSANKNTKEIYKVIKN